MTTKTHCRRGHPFTPRNVRLRRYKDREIRGCRLCESLNARRRYHEEGYKTRTKRGRGEPDLRLLKNQQCITETQHETSLDPVRGAVHIDVQWPPLLCT